jgi:hypothetical protein
MKIIITGLLPTDTNQHNIFYNTIKRFEEDFKRRIPDLQTFSFIIIERRGFEYENISCNHILDESEKQLTLTCFYRQLPTTESIVRELSGQLKSLLTVYY